MTNLTDNQKKIISDLTQEFEKVNKNALKENNFSLNTINKFIDGKNRFFNELNNFNTILGNELVNSFEAQITAIKKEFESVLTIKYDKDLSRYIDNLTDPFSYVTINFISKTKIDKRNDCLLSVNLYCRIGYDVIINKDSDIELRGFKINGLIFGLGDGFNDSNIRYSTLQELLNNNKQLQAQIIELIS